MAKIKDGLGPDHIVSSTMIDADVPANLVSLPTTGQPLAFYGTGRPDTAGLNLSAPVGSVFTCTDPDGGNNFGAYFWRKGPTAWVCIEGDTGYRSGPVGWQGDGAWIKMNRGREDDILPSQSTSSRLYRMRRVGTTVTNDFYVTTSLMYAKKNTFHKITFAGNDPFLAVVGYTACNAVFRNDSGAYGQAGINVLGSGFATSNSLGEGLAGAHAYEATNYGGAHFWWSGTTDAPWPTNPPPIVTRESILAEIEAIKDDPEQAALLQMLKDELDALERNNG